MNENTPGTPANRAVWDSWRSEIQAIGVTNPLITYDFDAFCQIDLDRAHPGGMAQFVSTGSSPLSNLVRDPLAFSKALAAAKRIDGKTHKLRDHFGIETCFIAAGLIGLEADGFDLRMPILLWPIKLIRTADDYEVRQNGTPIVNPALLDNLEVCYGINLNEADLLSKIQPRSDLVPVSLLETLAAALGVKAKAELKNILALGNFTTVPTQMLKDIKTIDVPLLNRLASDEGDVEPLGILAPNGVYPVADADDVQRRVASRALAGQSFAVETLPGCGYTQTVINTVAALTAARRRTLILAPRRQTIHELAERASSLGLDGLVTRSDSVWLDTISAISRNEKAKGITSGTAAVDLQEVSNRYGAYVQGLHSVDPMLGVSVVHVLGKLAELSAMPHAPETSARISRQSLAAHPDREAALSALTEAHELGEFRFGPQDSAWFQARFENAVEVAHVVSVAKRLRDETFPNLTAKLAEYIAAVEFNPADSVAEIGAYLRLFNGIRESLDRFVPSVFDRSLAEVIEATGERGSNSTMSGGTRRRLKKLAKEFVRPGMHVADINASLKAIELQREAWHRYSAGLKPPSVPTGINDAMVTYQALVVDLDQIQRHLDPQSNEPLLTELPLTALASKLDSLVEDTGALDNLAERAMVANRLRALGLEELMRDLARLHVSKEHLAAEFDLAWWQSALEYLAEKNPSLVRTTADQLDQLESEFQAASDAVLAENRANLAFQLGELWRSDLAGHESEAAALRALLKSGAATIAGLFKAAPHITANLLPNLAMSPYEVAHLLPEGQRFDTLIVLDGAGTTVAENLNGFLRADQVIVFGDDTIAMPAGFEIEARPIPIGFELKVPSVLSRVSARFGSEVLRRSYRTYGQILGSFINREFYQNRIDFEPTADDYWGNSHTALELVRSGDMASSDIPGANQSLDAEVERSVDQIFNHALWHPEDSLLFVTASPMHADRVRTAVQAGLKHKQTLMEFFDGHGREKFEIATLAELSHRVADHIIFSVGFGKLVRGRVPSEMGDLTGPNGRRYLANMLVSARKRLTLISCFAAADIPDDATNGLAHLRDLLQGGVRVEEPADEISQDPMLADLAIRLRKLGVTVKTDFGQNLSMIVSYGRNAIELRPDWLVTMDQLGQEINLRPRLVKALGWQVRRIHALQLFAEPDNLAKEIAQQLGLPVPGTSKPFIDSVKFEDTDAAWGDYGRGSDSGNDSRLKQDKPPHWG